MISHVYCLWCDPIYVQCMCFSFLCIMGSFLEQHTFSSNYVPTYPFRKNRSHPNCWLTSWTYYYIFMYNLLRVFVKEPPVFTTRWIQRGAPQDIWKVSQPKTMRNWNIWDNKVPILGDGHLKERMDGCSVGWTEAPQKSSFSKYGLVRRRPVRMEIPSFWTAWSPIPANPQQKTNSLSPKKAR